MRTSRIAFAAGGGGALSGWLLAAMLGAAQVQEETSEEGENGNAAEAQSVEESSSEGEKPELRLASTAIIEGPIEEYSYRVDQNQIRTTLNETDLFAWVYPEYAVIGPAGSDEVMVVPRESLVAIKMFDVTESPRQKYRKIANQSEPIREQPAGQEESRRVVEEEADAAEAAPNQAE